jgi:hypothetical protein
MEVQIPKVELRMTLQLSAVELEMQAAQEVFQTSTSKRKYPRALKFCDLGSGGERGEYRSASSDLLCRYRISF